LWTVSDDLAKKFDKKLKEIVCFGKIVIIGEEESAQDPYSLDKTSNMNKTPV